MKKDIKETRLKVFIENARIVPETELSNLPAEKREAVTGKSGLWLEVACPDGSCSLDQNKITLPAGGVVPKETKGLWLNLFCPDNQCEVQQGSQLLSDGRCNRDDDSHFRIRFDPMGFPDF